MFKETIFFQDFLENLYKIIGVCYKGIDTL